MSYPPVSVNVPNGSITPTNNIRPVRRARIVVGRRTILGHTLSFEADVDVYKLGTNNYIDWYNGIPNPPNISDSNAPIMGKIDESTLVVGNGLKLGVGSDILFKGNDVLGGKQCYGNGNKRDLPAVGVNFTNAPNVSLNRNLSELEAWVIVSHQLYMGKAGVLRVNRNIDFVQDKHSWRRKIFNQRGPLNVEYTPKNISVTDKSVNYVIQQHRESIDAERYYNRTSVSGVNHNAMYMAMTADHCNVDVQLPHETYSEYYGRGDDWVESSSFFKLSGNNNFIRIHVHANQSHLWSYGGNDGHRSLVSIEGYNNIVVVVVYGTLEIGFGDRYDNYGYWLASNDSRNLLIVQTADGSPLSSKVKWKNIENMNSAGTGPTTYFCKYDHNGEHNPFKSWI